MKENETVDAEMVDDLPNAPAVREYNFPITYVGAVALVEEIGEVPVIDPESENAKELTAEVKEKRIKLMRLRTGLDKERKVHTDPHLHYQKTLKAAVDKVIAVLKPVEDRLAIEENKLEAYEKQKRFEAEEKERIRVYDIEQKINAIRDLPTMHIRSNSDTVKGVIESLSIPEAEEYEELTDKAVAEYARSMETLESMFIEKEKAEQAERLEAERQEREAKEREAREAEERKRREEFEAEQREFREEQARAQEAIRLQQEEINRQNAEREAEELAKRQEAERKAREARQKETIDAQIKEATAVIDNMLKAEMPAAVIVNEIISGRVPNIQWVPDGE